MKKTDNINLGGQPFTVDQDAYKALDKYIRSIAVKFNTKGAKAEILDDIEQRMAEVLHEKLGERQIVTIQDIDDLKLTMGGPEVFEMEDEGLQDGLRDAKDPGPTNLTAKRLYKDNEHKIIGGVCAGLAHYFGMGKPIWMRLLFVFTFFSFGFGVMLYIILWIVLPTAETAEEIAEMMGDPVDLDDLSYTIKNELTGVKENFRSIIKSS